MPCSAASAASAPTLTVPGEKLSELYAVPRHYLLESPSRVLVVALQAGSQWNNQVTEDEKESEGFHYRFYIHFTPTRHGSIGLFARFFGGYARATGVDNTTAGIPMHTPFGIGVQLGRGNPMFRDSQENP
ncbi:hypothetical protein CISG_00449 [Coccidioides immitis RMSCC 3703]|uniref:Uncharacterized protein n=1 Tax=Coccidioides immitis RMSCC 3703 TaxID=454286 RepID=A0A0J8QI78_COCIT|nr:hypothetical protein CISG_00449 [Coccidioides immitis RMSCC 3703]